MKLLRSTFLAGLILVFPFLVSRGEVLPATRSYVDSKDTEVDLEYYRQATVLRDLVKHPASIKVIVAMLKAIDLNVPKFFPNGPFTRNDFIAMAWLESTFHQYEEGTHGERGIFQIMPDEFAAYRITKNFYNINVNTKMAFRVLSGKYSKWHDYKKAIIAYNGVVHLKNGKWSEKYWKAFYKRKVAVDAALAEK